MRARSGNFSAISLSVVAMACLWSTPAGAQFGGAGGPLGGYGASSDLAGPGMGGGGGAMVIPYGGMTEGFMPGRMGGGSSLSFRPRPSAAMDPSRTSSRLSPMSGGMSSTFGGSRPMAGGMGRGLGARSSMPGGPGSRGGIGLGGGSFRLGPGGGGGGMGVMPPSIGYPFRQPPSLLTPSSPGAGMSM